MTSTRIIVFIVSLSLSVNGFIPDWYIGSEAFTLVNNINSTLANMFFTGPNTYSSTAISPSVVITNTYQSYISFSNAVSNKTINSDVRAVLYDNENWSFTPQIEQVEFAYYFTQFCNLARANGYKCILTPAVDLVQNLSCNGTTKYQKFLNCNIAYAAGLVADIFEIQAQGSEASLSSFTSFVTSAVAQARSANPNVTVWVGLSTNPTGNNVTGEQLFLAYQATAGSLVSGYWLNIPGQSPYCPSCGVPQPQVAVDFLNLILTNYGPFTTTFSPSPTITPSPTTNTVTPTPTQTVQPTITPSPTTITITPTPTQPTSIPTTTLIHTPTNTHHFISNSINPYSSWSFSLMIAIIFLNIIIL
jgi:hypothetical protein